MRAQAQGRSEGGHAASQPQASSSSPIGLLPAIPVFRLSFLRFLLVLAGVTAGVVGTWNVERRAQVDDLREELRRKEGISLELRRALAEERKVYDGLAVDPRVEKHLLEHVLGRGDDRGIPLDRWLAGERFDPDP